MSHHQCITRDISFNWFYKKARHKLLSQISRFFYGSSIISSPAFQFAYHTLSLLSHFLLLPLFLDPMFYPTNSVTLSSDRTSSCPQKDPFLDHNSWRHETRSLPLDAEHKRRSFPRPPPPRELLRSSFHV